MGVANLTGEHGTTQGEDDVFRIQFFSDEAGTVPVDITTNLTECEFIVSDKPGGTEVFSVTLTGGGIAKVAPLTDGTVEVTVSSPITAAADPAIYAYIVRVTNLFGDGLIKIPMWGSYEIMAG